MKRLVSLAAALVCSLAFALPLLATEEAATVAGATAKSDAKPVPEAKTFVTKHQIKMRGATLAYTATAGSLLMKNDADEPIALFGFTSYVKDGGDPRTRPILFAYNGGPGSASAWLHMGILGPKRTVLADVEFNTQGPFRTVDNEFGILDLADLVMVDPIGTGFSRPIGKGEGKQFWGVDQDIASVSSFIVRYLGEFGRWASPKFVLGESYGGMRTGGVSFELLSKYNVALNGVILVSPYLDVAAGYAGLRIDEPYVNFLSTFAATAWYHQALSNRPAELQPFLREAEAFAEDVYAPVLYKGSRASAAERQAVLEGLERYTGVSKEYWDRANLRLDEGRFLQELMRDRGIVVGRIDSRYQGGTIGGLSEFMRYDPYASAIAPAIVATFNDYYRRELEVESDRPYQLSGGVDGEWDERHAQPDLGGYKSPIANTAVDLAHAMTMNPKMNVLVQQGYFDLAVPYRSVEYVLDHLEIAPELRKNVAVAYYEAGHMMYVHPPSMVKFRANLAAFVESNSR